MWGCGRQHPAVQGLGSLHIWLLLAAWHALAAAAAEGAEDAHSPRVVLPLVGRRVSRPSCFRHSLNCSGVEELWALAKSNVTGSPGALSLSASAKSEHDIPLLDIGNTQYRAVVGLGTPLQTAEVLIDTGSSDLWVKSDTMEVGKSKSALRVPGSVTITYGQGTVTGSVFSDRVDFGNVVLEDQHFLIPSASVGMGSIQADGVMGLALPGLSHTGETILQSLYKETKISTFCLLLTNTVQGSYLVLGEPDPDWYVKDMTWTNVVSEQWWAFKGEFRLEGQTLISGGFLLDSGTSYLMLPAGPVFNTMIAAIFEPDVLRQCEFLQMQNSIVCPCEIAEKARTVDLHVEGVDFPLRPYDVLLPSGGGWCTLQMMPMNAGLPPILGDTFLRTVLATFDTKRKRIGLAKRTGKSPWPMPFLSNDQLLFGAASAAMLPLSALACFVTAGAPCRRCAHRYAAQAREAEHAAEPGVSVPYQVL